MELYSNRKAYITLKSNLRKETGKNPFCKLTSIQQNMVLKTFSPLQNTAEPNIPMAESLIMQYYFMPDVSRSWYSEELRLGHVRKPDHLTTMVKGEFINPTLNLDIDNIQDGVTGKILKTRLLNDMHNRPELLNTSEEIHEFIKDIPGKKSKYLKEFIEMTSLMDNEYTDLYMVYGELADPRILDQVKKSILLIYVFIGEDYVVCYNTTAEKSDKLRSRTRAVVATRSITGTICAYRLALSTLKKKTTTELWAAAKFDKVTKGKEVNVYNNIQEDCLDCSTIRKLAEVI